MRLYNILMNGHLFLYFVGDDWFVPRFPWKQWQERVIWSSLNVNTGLLLNNFSISVVRRGIYDKFILYTSAMMQHPCWHWVELSFHLWTCGYKHLRWRMEIPNYTQIYQHLWYMEPLHWKSHCMCNAYAPRNIWPGQRNKYLPRKSRIHALQIRKDEKMLSLIKAAYRY